MSTVKAKPPVSEVEVEFLEVEGARVHNLRNVSVKIPRNQFVVITGISGSGKSSLAFDTIYAEGQRRYIESFSAYARQFLGNMERPDVDRITGLSPVISIEQKTTNKNPRSTVGTVTEIYDFIRLFYARVGEAYSHVTGKKMERFNEGQIFDHIKDRFAGNKIILLAPLVKGRKGHYRELFERIRKQGFLKVRVDGEIVDLKDKMQVDRYKIHDIEAVIDRIVVEEKFEDRLKQSLNSALASGNGLCMILDHETDEVFQFSQKLMCTESGVSYDEPSPNTFSFNSPYGACPTCKGLGVIREVDAEALIPDASKSINKGGLAPLGELKDNYAFRELRALSKKLGFNFSQPIKDIKEDALNIILHGTEVPESTKKRSRYAKKPKADYEGLMPMLQRAYNESSSEHIRKWAEEFMHKATCPECNGQRLKKESLHFKIAGKNIAAIAQMDIRTLADWFESVGDLLSEKQLAIGRDVVKEIKVRLKFLLDVGLDYLMIDRPARTLSGGESQRIRLATQIGSQLMGITYILDEPSIGLHQRDNQRLIGALKELTQVGNTVMVVEHDRDIMLASDYLIDIGPGAGIHGGKIVAEGVPEDFKLLDSPTANFLKGERMIAVPEKRRKGNGKSVKLTGAKGHNLKKVDLEIPLGKMVCVTGVSGSGKSSLINQTLYLILRKALYRSRQKALPYKSFEGLEHIDKVIEIDQSPIGRTPRSNPATYIGVFTDIRSLFAKLPEAKVRGYKPGRFSFNVKSGRCEECEGGGMKVIEMNFLPDVYVECPKCFGRRYNRETLEVRYKGKSISDVLEMSIEEAVEFFEAVPNIYRKVKTLHDVGLDYLTLGQSSTTLSGGEAQRVKLAEELSKRDTGQTFYILDEPTTGLHFQDIQMLLRVLNRLVDKGNTVLIIEHNMDVIKVADHIIDIGPEGGSGGGKIVATGTPEEVAKEKGSYTGKFLREELS